MIRTFQGITPTVPQSCFIEETAVVIGDVVMGGECSAWFHAVIRGDVNYIRIGHRTNVQDLCMLHVTHDTHPLIIGDDVTIGHNVVLHGCTIQNRVLVGMGAIISIDHRRHRRSAQESHPGLAGQSKTFCDRARARLDPRIRAKLHPLFPPVPLWSR